MYEIDLKGVNANIENDYIIIKGSLGSTKKKFNKKFVDIKIENGKILIIPKTDNKRLKKFSENIANALKNEIERAVNSVNNGITVSAHFPLSLEVKGDKLIIKNIYGERVPREAKIIGDTKIEIKGQEVYVKGVDIYDVNQTIANIINTCKNMQKDQRVFQDGIYPIKEE